MKQPVRLLTGILLTLQFSCNHADTTSETVATEKIKIVNQGVNIDYDDSKIGDTTILFIHGWAIDRTYWADQVTFFTKKYRVVTVDLPGFGQSGKNRESWTIENYGKDISAVLTQLDLKNVILVGHSMSGGIALEAALTNPTRIIGVVGVDNFKWFGVPETPERKEGMANFLKIARADYKDFVVKFVTNDLTSPSTDSLVKQRVINSLISVDPKFSVDCLEQAFSYPYDEKIRTYKKTLYLINSDLPPTDTLAYQKNKIDYCLLSIGPTGHYPMLEKPDEFNLLLQQAISRIKK